MAKTRIGTVREKKVDEEERDRECRIFAEIANGIGKVEAFHKLLQQNNINNRKNPAKNWNFIEKISGNIEKFQENIQLSG